MAQTAQGAVLTANYPVHSRTTPYPSPHPLTRNENNHLRRSSSFDPCQTKRSHLILRTTRPQVLLHEADHAPHDIRIRRFRWKKNLQGVAGEEILFLLYHIHPHLFSRHQRKIHHGIRSLLPPTRFPETPLLQSHCFTSLRILFLHLRLKKRRNHITLCISRPALYRQVRLGRPHLTRPALCRPTQLATP